MYEVDFFNSSMYAELWSMIGGLTRYIGPFLMIALSLLLVGWLIKIIITTVRSAFNKNDKSMDDYDDRQPRENAAKYDRKHKY